MREKKQEKRPSDISIDYSITNKEIKFSDLVKIDVKKDGFLLTFTQRHPASDEATCIAEIILPPEVAVSLGTIILNHAIKYENMFKMKILPKSVKIEGAKKKKELKG